MDITMDLRHKLQAALGDAYTLDRELSGGGMAHVFVATEHALGRQVAIKVLSPQLAAGVSIDRFTREILMVASLQQANIVPVLTAGTSNGLPYFIMPLVDGESIRARLEREGTLPMGDVVSIGRDVARALAYAHARYIVHRDIKPDNVLLSGGTAVVTDFGIAKAITASRTTTTGASSSKGVAPLTQFGIILGTPAYMSPEQAAGEPDIDHRSDLYSLGCLLYELLAGKPPFANRSAQRVLAAHLGETPTPIGMHCQDVPPVLGDLIMQCLAKEPAARPQQAEMVAQLLDRVLHAQPHPISVATHSDAGVSHRVLRSALVWSLIGYVVVFATVVLVARLATARLGLPSWVPPGAAIVMLLGLPAILLTHVVYRLANRAHTLASAAATSGTIGGHVRAAGSNALSGDRNAQDSLSMLAAKARPRVSWQRTWFVGTIAILAFALFVAAYMALRAAGIGPMGSLWGAQKLSPKDPLLVASCDGPLANDNPLGPTLAQSLRSTLGQSKVVEVVPYQVIAPALQRMRQPLTDAPPLTVAQELAQREGIKAVVACRIAFLAGGGYMISARILSGAGDELATVSETARSSDDLMPAVDRLAGALREKIGESLTTIRATTPLAQVTTASFDAWREYDIGWRAMYIEGDPEKATSHFRKAFQHDTAFAMAYFQYSFALAGALLGTPSIIHEAWVTAYNHRERLSPSEQLLIEAFEFGGQGAHPDRVKFVAALEALLERFPNSAEAINLLGNLYNSRGKYAQAESLYRRARAIDSTNRFPAVNIVVVQMREGAFERAHESLELARRRLRPETVNAVQARMLYAEDRLDSLGVFLDSLTTSTFPGAQRNALRQRSALYALRGQMSKSTRMLQHLRALDTIRGAPPMDVDDAIAAAITRVLYYDDQAGARARLAALVASKPFTSPFDDRARYLALAKAWALAGEPTRARETLRQYEREVRDTVARRVDSLPRLATLAWIALAENRPLDAVANFHASALLPDGPTSACLTCIDASLGRAYDRANMTDSAIVALQRFVNARGNQFEDNMQDRAWALKRLGELWDRQGDRKQARKYLTQFVELWKDADPDLQPFVRAAQRRLDQLRALE